MCEEYLLRRWRPKNCLIGIAYILPAKSGCGIGPLVGPRPVDKEEILRMLRVPGGKWIVFSMFLVADDPAPEMI